jgi:hypothetical protein
MPRPSSAVSNLFFPGVADIIHGRHMFRPDNMDIDMYRFDLNERGQVDIEVLAERLNNSSLLDASITLYREVQVAQKYVVIEKWCAGRKGVSPDHL